LILNVAFAARSICIILHQGMTVTPPVGKLRKGGYELQPRHELQPRPASC
jgi:hypothetical protein